MEQHEPGLERPGVTVAPARYKVVGAVVGWWVIEVQTGRWVHQHNQRRWADQEAAWLNAQEEAK